VPPPEPTTEDIAEKLFDKHEGFVLPFEIASVLLLAAMIGAIVLVRERKEE
jgi:NADH-quinone oxidoreductase subunit J